MELDLAQIKQVLDSGSGLHLKEYLTLKLNELRSIENVKEIESVEGQALEVKSQKKAYLKLKEIFSEIMTLDEEPQVKKPEDSYAV